MMVKLGLGEYVCVCVSVCVFTYMSVSVCTGGEHIQLPGGLLHQRSQPHRGTGKAQNKLWLVCFCRERASCMYDIMCVLQIVLETERQTLSFSVLHVEDLEAMVSHMTASLKRIFPDSSPG